jgi:Ca2+-binding EF-hand superfamily protein
MKTNAILGIGVLSLGMMAMPGVVRAQEHRDMDLPSPMEAIRNMQNTGRMMFMLADVNHDGLISQKEAVDANNVLVGGYFFQADTDGNGVVSQQEAKAARDNLLNQNPWARYVAESLEAQAKNPQNSNRPNPLLGFSALLDANNDKQIQASELKQLVQTTTQSFFAAADTNRDGQMSPSEVNAAVAGGIRAMAQMGFQQADTDNNGSLSRAEFDKAIVEPANMAFQIIDLNHDGQVSQQEAQQIERGIISQIRMIQLPEPANSPTNLIEQGKLPEEAGQVPTFSAPTGGQNRQQGGRQQGNRQPGGNEPGQPTPPR